MKHLILLLLILVGSFRASSQTIDNLDYKYWQYRARFLDKFILKGIDPDPCGNIGGYSLPISHIVSDYDVLNQEYIVKEIHFGDTPQHIGWYFGVLATEYSLLSKAGKSTDATLEELYMAFQAFYRLDKKAESHKTPTELINSNNCNNNTNFNGLILRDDASRDFFDLYFETKKNDIVKFASTINPKATFRNNSESNYTGCTTWGGNKMSKDHVTHLMMGLSMVVKFCKGVSYQGFNLEEEARSSIYRVLKYIENNGWYILAPDGSFVDHESVYEGAWLLSNGYMAINLKYGKNSLNCPNGNLVINTCLNSLLTWQGAQNGLDAVSRCAGRSHNEDPGPEWGNSLSAIAGALCGNWVGFDGIFPFLTACNTTYSKVYAMGNQFESWFHPLLFLVMNDLDIRGFVDNNHSYCDIPGDQKLETILQICNVICVNFTFSQGVKHPGVSDRVKEILDRAPCDGPQYQVKSSTDRGIWGWNIGNRFEKYKSAYYEYEGRLLNAEYNGLDFMLLHNLYKIGLGQSNMENFYNHFDNRNYSSTATLSSLGPLTSSSTIGSGANVIFNSPTSINLIEKFDTQIGSSFDAFINKSSCVSLIRTAPYCGGGEGRRSIEALEEDSSSLDDTDIKLPFGISSFPNPTEDNCIIEFNIQRLKPTVISIYNIQGVEIERKELISQIGGKISTQFDLTKYIPGLYNFLIFDDLQRFSGKIIKK